MQHKAIQTQAEGPLAAHRALYTDLYELTWPRGTSSPAGRMNWRCSIIFSERTPFDGGFVVFAGLDDLLDFLQGLSFGQDDIA